MSDITNAGPRWDVSRVTSFFEGLKAAPASAAEDTPAAATPYHPAAAVLAAFDTATLKGLDGPT